MREKEKEKNKRLERLKKEKVNRAKIIRENLLKENQEWGEKKSWWRIWSVKVMRDKVLIIGNEETELKREKVINKSEEREIHKREN